MGARRLRAACGRGERAAARSQVLVLDPVRAPRQGRLLRAALGLRGFREELEDGREALPRSELVTVGACGNTHRVTRGSHECVAGGEEPALQATAPPPASSPPAQGPRVPPAPGVPGARRLACPHPRPALSRPAPPRPARTCRLGSRVTAGSSSGPRPSGPIQCSAGRATPSPAQKPPTSPGLGLVFPQRAGSRFHHTHPGAPGVLASQAEWGE